MIKHKLEQKTNSAQAISISGVVVAGEHNGFSALTPDGKGQIETNAPVAQFLSFNLEKVHRYLCTEDGGHYIELTQELNEDLQDLLPTKRKIVKNFINFKVTPAVHAGYSATWFGMSAIALATIRYRFFR